MSKKAKKILGASLKNGSLTIKGKKKGRVFYRYVRNKMAYVGSNVHAKACQRKVLSEDRKAADGLFQTGRKQPYLESEVDPGGGEEGSKKHFFVFG